MKGWLDNYGKEENYNDSHTSAPEGFEGDGYSNVGRNYSPAWGGQFQMGGNIYSADYVPRAQNGLWKENRKAFVDSTLNANKHLDFVKRLYDQSKGSIQIPGVPGRSTHYMADDKNRIYPTVVNKNGKLQYLKDPDEAWEYANDTGEYIDFKTPEQAAWFANSPDHTTGYKMGTNVLTTIPHKQMGGSIPGSVGFTYAREGAPSNGPYAKKTMASAENGTEMRYYQNGLDWKPKGMRDGGWLDGYEKAQFGKKLTPEQIELQKKVERNNKKYETQNKYNEYQENKRKTADLENKKAWAKSYVQANMEKVYEHPLASPGYFTPEGMAIGALQGATKLGPDLYEGKYKEAAMDALMVLPETGNIAKALGPSEGLLSNAWKLNPKAYQYNIPKNTMWRGLGQEGMEDAVNSGLFRAKQNVIPEYFPGSKLRANKEFNSVYFTPKFKTAATYGDKYLAEVPEDAANWSKRYKNSDWSQFSKEPIPVDKGRILQKDWLQGYKEVPKPKTVEEELVDLYRVQEKEAKTFAQLAAEGKIPKAFNNPEVLARKAEEEKHFGQWFTNDKSDLDWYMKDREFVDPEIIQLRVPKSKLSQYQNYDKTLSRAPEREFVIPHEEQKLYKPIEVPKPTSDFKSEIDWGKEYFEKIQNKEKELQDLFFSKKITEKEYLEGVPLYEKELAKELGLENKLGSGNYGKVFESPNDPSKVIKLGNPMSGGGTGATNWTPELIEKLKSIKQNANIAIPEQVEYFEIPSLYQGYGPKTKEVMTMPNLNQVAAENLNLNKRDRYALFLKQARQLRDQGIQLDVKNIENFKFNKDKGVFDIYDINPGYISNPGYYMQDVVNKTRGPLFEHMQFKQGGIIRDDRGQWDHPGEITEINSNDITMKGVPYPVLGVSDTGHTQMMYPGEEYEFIGEKVTEYPMAKNGVNQADENSKLQLNQLTNFTNYNTDQPGGWLDKYADGGEVGIVHTKETEPPVKVVKNLPASVETKKELSYEQIPTKDNKKVVIDNFSPHYDYIVEGDKTYYKVKGGNSWADISNNTGARKNLLEFLDKNNYWAGYGSGEKEKFEKTKHEPLVVPGGTVHKTAPSVIRNENSSQRPVIVKRPIKKVMEEEPGFFDDITDFLASGVASTNNAWKDVKEEVSSVAKKVKDSVESGVDKAINTTEDAYHTVVNGIKRKYATHTGDDEDVKVPVDTAPKTVKEWYANKSGAEISAVMDAPNAPGRTYKQQVLPTSNIKFGVRNRGEYKDIKTDGLELTTFHPFSSKPLPDNTTVLAVDPGGNLHTGQYKDFKGQKGYQFSQTFKNNIVDFSQANGKNEYISGEKSGNPSYQQPKIKVLDDNGKIINGSLNILVKDDSKKDYYGSVQGGRILFVNPDTKQQYLVSGSMEHIKQKFKEIKGNAKYLEAYTLDNGTYSRGLSYKDKKLTKDRLKSYDLENTSGGNGLYIIDYKQQMSKFPEQYIDNMPNIRTKKDKSFKEGHPLKNSVKNIILHHTAYTGPNSEQEVTNQYMTPGKSSSHVVIQPDGKRTIYASPEQVTFHAGESRWNNKENLNDFSLGVEFQGDTNLKPLTQAQIESFVEYYTPIAKKYNLSLKDVITHQMVRDDYMKAHSNNKGVKTKPDISNKEYSRILSYMKSKKLK